jgi:hypothetical protein
LKWIGSRAVGGAVPVRITAGAFGDGQPHRDLWLSPDHAVCVDGALIPVRYLVNGTTITEVACDAVTYWHVELETHAVLFAEGLAAESYLGAGNRAAFHPASKLTPADAASQCAAAIRAGTGGCRER